jgi:hypothetical protein
MFVETHGGCQPRFEAEGLRFQKFPDVSVDALDLFWKMPVFRILARSFISDKVLQKADNFGFRFFDLSGHTI